MTVPSPFVYWAQNEDNLYLKVDLKDVKEPRVELESRKLHFQSTGTGAQGFKDYQFNIIFHSDVKDKKTVKVTDHKIDLVVMKAQKGWWPRLTSHPQKPAWLKIDFDKWQSEEDLMDEEIGDIREEYPGLYKDLQKEEMGYIKEEFKKVYLTLYNLFMYIAYLYIACVLCVKYTKEGTDFFPETYRTVGHVFCFVQSLQLLEVMHPLFGYVRGGVLMPLFQTVGRLFVLFLMLDQEPRIQKMPVTFYLFLSWSAIEIIRYPYYLTQLYKREVGILTWLRYTAWIVLYPIGFLCEGVIVFRNLIFVEQSQKWSVSLPNPVNFTFHFATFLRIYLLFIMAPVMYTLMSHMHKVRNQKLNRKGRIKKSK